MSSETHLPKNVPNAEHRKRNSSSRGLDKEVVEGLRQNFMGECTEVGMYLAMSRQAEREGYPEVAEAYKRIAFEGAEHGACKGKLDLAKRAKELNYDAVHDTVHEMCKDEARHGAAFDGLLKRYFTS